MLTQPACPGTQHRRSAKELLSRGLAECVPAVLLLNSYLVHGRDQPTATKTVTHRGLGPASSFTLLHGTASATHLPFLHNRRAATEGSGGTTKTVRTPGSRLLHHLLLFFPFCSFHFLVFLLNKTDERITAAGQLLSQPTNQCQSQRPPTIGNWHLRVVNGLKRSQPRAILCQRTTNPKTQQFLCKDRLSGYPLCTYCVKPRGISTCAVRDLKNQSKRKRQDFLISAFSSSQAPYPSL